MISKLALQEIPSSDCKYLRLVDNSYYNPSLTIANEILEITPPGYDCPVVFNVDHHFNSVFNSTTLNINSSQSGSHLMPLPDGVYHLKYSINPNAALFVEYDLFRNCQLMSRYAQAICKLFSKKCDLSLKQFEESRRDLIWIKELIDASKYLVEECSDIKAGLELYNEAYNLLNNVNKCYCGK